MRAEMQLVQQGMLPHVLRICEVNAKSLSVLTPRQARIWIWNLKGLYLPHMTG